MITKIIDLVFFRLCLFCVLVMRILRARRKNIWFMSFNSYDCTCPKCKCLFSEGLNFKILGNFQKGRMIMQHLQKMWLYI